MELAEILINKVESGDHNYQTLADLYSLLNMMEKKEFDFAHKHNNKVKEIALLKTQDRDIDIEMLRKWYNLYRRSLLFDAPHNFDDYMLYLEIDRPAKERFYLPRRRVFKHIADTLQEIVDGKLDLVGVSLPPGAGKTTLGTFFLSFLMGKDPELPNLASGHSSKLTRSMFDGVKAIIQDPDYNFYDIFPTTTVESISAKDETINFGKSKRFKTLTCRSIEGTLTGATRCKNILYADDLVSGIEEAMNIDRMDKLWEAYVNDLRSRKLDGCAEVHVATRWSVHDPLGRLSEIHANNPRAKFIVIPALDENEESNLVYDHGVGFSTEYFLDMRNIMSSVEWEALYQNNPIEREGILFPKEELNYFWELPDREPDHVLASVDVAEGGGDYTAMPVGYLYGDDVYIVDAVFNDGYPGITKPRIINTIIKHRIDRARFESNSAGGEYADSIQKELVEKGYTNNTITKKRSTSNKITRMIISSDDVKTNFFFRHPESLTDSYKTNQMVHREEYNGFMNQLTRFTVKGRNPNDDAPDSISQLQEHIRSLRGNTVTVIDRPF